MRRAIVFAAAVGIALGCAQLGDVKGRFGEVGRTAERFKTTAQDAQANLEDAKEKVEKVGAVLEDLVKDLTPENEYWVGRSVAANILAKNRYAYLDKDAVAAGKLAGVTEYVNSVGALLGAAAEESRRDGDRPAPLAGWHFVVLDTDEVNAFAAPGGFVFVTRGAVKAARSEDELACVLAHEIAHVARGHGLGSVKRSRYANLSSDLVKKSGVLSTSELGQLEQLLSGSIDDMMNSLFVEGYSQETEFEADEVGSAIASAAGYDPKAMVGFLQTLRSLEGGKAQAYKTHPSSTERIRALAAGQPAAALAGLDARTARFKAAVGKLQ